MGLNPRQATLFGAIGLGVLAALAVAMASPGSVAPWLIGTVWIATAALMVGAVVALARSRRALGESERRFRSMFETASVGVAVSTPDGRLLEVNEKLASMLGYEPAELVGMTVREITHADDADEGLQHFRELIEGTRTSYTVEKRYVRKDGTALWGCVNASLVRDQLGRPQLGIGLIEDISARKQAEELLRQAEIRYRTLVEQLPLVTYIDALDDRSTNLYTSPQIESLLGYSVDEWQEDRDLFVRLLHPEDRDRVLAETARTNRTGEPFLEEYRLIARDGRTVWFRDEAVVVHDDKGRPLHAQGYLLDITERKRAEEAVRESGHRFRTLIENIPGAVFRCTVDDGWTITFMSAAIEEISGYPPADFVGNASRTFASIIHPHDRRRVEQAVREAIQLQRPFIVEYRIVTAAGETRWVYEKGQPVFGKDGETPWLDGVIFDISDRKESEHERERLLAALESQNEQLRALDTMKDEFVALVSHELRTPLTSILGYLELVLEGEAGEVTDDQRHFLSVVERNSRRLLRLVGDLLFVAQIEAGKLALECEAVDLGLIVSECLEAARPRAAEKRIELVPRIAPVPLLSGDRVRLAQLLDNLVSNAIKFTPEGGRVTVGLDHKAGSVSLEVSDTGMGIPPDEQSRLFERFFRTAGATKNAIQGTGLGLVITKAIAEAHGGRISLESEENVGTTFRVELPLQADVQAMDEAA
jgi:PAS domain S-box-containing protein